jgi:pantothenate kinase type III
MQSGILYGFAGQIDGVVNRMAEELADDPNDVTVVATGGLARWCSRRPRSSTSTSPGSP